jgi:K+-transporting ATPase ATPase C chain
MFSLGNASNGSSEGGESTDPGQGGESRRSQTLAALREQLRPVLLSVPLLTLLTGVVFPLFLAVLARPLFSHQAAGSLIVQDRVIGSELIGQGFNGPGYFHPRPSAAGRGYDAAASSGTNLGPANSKLRDGTKDDPATQETDESFAGVRELAEDYRTRNGLAPGAPIPVDAVTRSGSGLDPHISPANAALQVPRVARIRRLSESEVRRLVSESTSRRQFGLLGEPRVAVLPLNLALDRIAPLPARPRWTISGPE